MQEKVLIIEDSPTQAAVIGEIVASLGMRPVIYHNVPTSVAQLLEVESPDIVLLDLRLLNNQGVSVGDGFQICKEIKRVQKGLPVIVVSSEPLEEAGEWARMQGADAFLQKPFVPEDLKSLIVSVIEEGRG